MILRSFQNNSLPHIPGGKQESLWHGNTAPNSPTIRIRDRTPTRNATVSYPTYEDLFESQIDINQVEASPTTESVAIVKLSSHAREKLIRKIRPSRTQALYKTKAQIGFVAYVGSPVNGHMVIGNPDMVDIWLNYVRKAIKNKLVKTSNSALTTKEMSKVCNVNIIPGNRHEFNIAYKIHEGLSCSSHKHDKRIWESPSYPSTIISCECLTQQLGE
jgi:hypothetical protein